MSSPPTGTITFLFVDFECSTWLEQTVALALDERQEV
jgi:hypothetical protein